MFQPGDVVRLKSHGPLMTVEGYSDGRVICVFFDERKTVVTHFFLEACLQLWED